MVIKFDGSLFDDFGFVSKTFVQRSPTRTASLFLMFLVYVSTVKRGKVVLGVPSKRRRSAQSAQNAK